MIIDTLLSVLQTFCREAVVWKTLNHRYVLPFLGIDVESFPRQPCVVSPWMTNGTINEFLQQNHAKEKVDVNQLVRQFCKNRYSVFSSHTLGVVV